MSTDQTHTPSVNSNNKFSTEIVTNKNDDFRNDPSAERFLAFTEQAKRDAIITLFSDQHESGMLTDSIINNIVNSNDILGLDVVFLSHKTSGIETMIKNHFGSSSEEKSNE